MSCPGYLYLALDTRFEGLLGPFDHALCTHICAQRAAKKLSSNHSVLSHTPPYRENSLQNLTLALNHAVLTRVLHTSTVVNHSACLVFATFFVNPITTFI